MKLTKNFYQLLCSKYKQVIDKETNEIASQIEGLANKKKQDHTILDNIYNITEAKDKLESLRDFWKWNGTSK
ncbi:hypothetical protein N9Z41_02335 [bacterium]|nr:hypothetical protein [bacterium]